MHAGNRDLPESFVTNGSMFMKRVSCPEKPWETVIQYDTILLAYVNDDNLLDKTSVTCENKREAPSSCSEDVVHVKEIGTCSSPFNRMQEKL